MMLLAVNYHYVRPKYDEPYEGIFGITPAQLDAQLTALSRAGEFVSAELLRAGVAEPFRLPERAIAITFDDGFAEHLEHALPVLERHGVPGIFYVNSRPIDEHVVCHHHKLHLLRAHLAPEKFLSEVRERAARLGVVMREEDLSEATTQYRYDKPEVARLKYFLNLKLEESLRDRLVVELFRDVLGEEEPWARKLYLNPAGVKELSRRAAVGSHSHDHLALGIVGPQRARDELRSAAKLIEGWTGQKLFTFSWPFGSRSATSREVAAVAREDGYVFSFTMERAVNSTVTDPLQLARFDTNDVPGGKSCHIAPERFFESAPRRAWYGADR